MIKSAFSGFRSGFAGPIAAVPTPSGPTNPFDPSLILWLDSTSLSGTAWTDKSGNGNDFTWNSAPSIDGAGGALTAGSKYARRTDALNNHTSTSYTIIIWSKRSSFTNPGPVYIDSRRTDNPVFSSNGIISVANGGSPTAIRYGTSSNYVESSNQFANDGSWYMYTLEKTVGASANLKGFYNNKVQEVNYTESASNATLLGTKMTIGADAGDSPSHWLQGAIGPVLIFNAVNIDTSLVWNYYKANFGY